MSRPKAGSKLAPPPTLLGGMSSPTPAPTPTLPPAPAPAPLRTSGPPAPVVRCPFSIVVDTREQAPYTFDGLKADADLGNATLQVRTVRYCLPQGDYQVFGLPGFLVERKSKEDLFGSVARRDNFIGRLELMYESRSVSAVVVEAEISEILARPPRHSKLNVKALVRTIQAWSLRYPTVHWHFLPGREAAEAWTFRLLERYWKDHKDEVIEAVHREPEGGRVSSVSPVDGRGDRDDAARDEPCPLCGGRC